MVSEYKLNLYPHKDLIIYEMGGGHGRLMPHIMDYIERYEPSVYKRTQYNMIELSDRLVSPSFIKHAPKHEGVQVLNQNIFDWNTLVTEQCFFLGMEVIVSLGSVIIERLLIKEFRTILLMTPFDMISIL